MFENLGERLSQTLRKLTGKAVLSEDNIRESLREVRMALLEADVALPVVRDFVERVRERAVGLEVAPHLSPGQQFLKVVREELTRVMGEAGVGLRLDVPPPAVLLLAGLQGAGKTTTAAKLARYLRERERKRVMVVSTDVRRPAAIRQLALLAEEVGALWHPSSEGEDPLAIAREALAVARRQLVDVLIVDTAGRLHVDEALMDEVRALHQALSPVETLFVVDAMMGQDAVNAARAFGEALPLTGVVLTKVDGDARGGAALSVRQVTGKPIKFLGAGEKTDALEPFHPDRIASRILGMGDVLTLIEEVERKVDRAKAEKLAKKVAKGKGFDLEDLREQLREMQKLGGMAALLEKLPGGGNLAKVANPDAMAKEFRKMEAIINSMTPRERRNPDILNGSRKRRITRGSGTTIQDLNRLLKQHKQMAKMMKKFKGKGLANLARGLPGGLSGGLPRF
ncbi:MAG: signal recognition particle protein [Porticoccaceae bacterium]|nr:MAG: signal recognition particle protein [Porticoccaceae bacterium]